MKAAAYYGKSTGTSCQANTPDSPTGCYETPQFSKTRFCYNRFASGGAHPQNRPVCLLESCLDISDKYNRDGSSKDVTLSQTACSGSSSDGWRYTVKGRVATIGNDITGDIVGQSPPYTIVWSNGITYVSWQKKLQFRAGNKGSTACPDGTMPLTLQECGWAARAFGKAAPGEQVKTMTADWLPAGCLWNDNSWASTISYNLHESGGVHKSSSPVCKVVSEKLELAS